MKIVKRELLPLTPTLAARVAGADDSAVERKLSATRQQLLAREFGSNGGPALPFLWTLALLPDGKRVRVNGNHTSRMFVEGMVPYYQDAVVLYTEIECKDLDEVAEAWGRYDGPHGTRTRRDSVRAWQMADPDLSKYSTRTIGLAMTGIALATESGVQVSPEIGRTMHGNKGFLAFAAEMVPDRGKASRMLDRGPVYAAMYLTYRKAPTDAKSFWTAVRDGTGAAPSSPDRVLQVYLLSTSVGAGRGAAQFSEDRVTMMRKCLRAWNAWREGRAELKVLKAGGKPEVK
jgi:hypothetical protein